MRQLERDGLLVLKKYLVNDSINQCFSSCVATIND